MKPPGEGVQGALSTDLLTRQRITPKLRLHMTAAFDRVACTYKGVCIADDGHGTWKVLGLQPRANTNLFFCVCSLHGCILLFFSILGGTGRSFNLTGTPPQEQFQDVSISGSGL